MKKNLNFLKVPLMRISQIETFMAKKWVENAFKRYKLVEWGLGSSPEFFDHEIDLYYQWGNTRNPLRVERGVFGGLALAGGKVLELACGDGFNAKHFYSIKAEKIIACDFDETALKIARSKNSAPNVTHVLADIRYKMPGNEGQFDNVIWDAAIEHFTEVEIFSIMTELKKRLKVNGILSGYTILERDDGIKHLHQHEYEFKSKEDLFRFLAPYFKNVSVFETVYESRHNLYFWASDSIIPFSEGWGGGIRGLGSSAL